MSAPSGPSARHQFADQWYDLHNPDQTATPMVAHFKSRRDDLPPHLEDLRIQHVLLAVIRAEGQLFEMAETELRFTPAGETVSVGGSSATSVDGVFSTRRSNAPAWTTLIGRSPIGDWQLSLPNTEEVKNHFQNEAIEDILLVITYAGRSPAWPT